MIATEMAIDMDSYLRGCTFHPVYADGGWILGCQFRTLLDACYFRLMLDMVEGAGVIRRCKYNKCRRFFLALPEQRYCCKQHQVRASVDRSRNREIRDWLRALRRDGRIDNHLHDAARIEADRLYSEGNEDFPGGIKETDTLRREVQRFLDQNRGSEVPQPNEQGGN